MPRFQPVPPSASWSWATVEAIADGRADLSFGVDGDATSVPVHGEPPAVGSRVLVLLQGASALVLGKSGTLNGVIATSGVLYNRHDGHRYAIGILFNDVSNDGTARALQDDIVETIARDHRGLGARPATPVLQRARPFSDGTVEFSWTSVGGATAAASTAGFTSVTRSRSSPASMRAA